MNLLEPIVTSFPGAFENSENGRHILSQLLFVCAYYTLEKPRNLASELISSGLSQMIATNHPNAQFLLTTLQQLKVHNMNVCFNWEERLVSICENTEDSPGKDHCQKAVNNGYWEICQTLIDKSRCDKYQYKSTTTDFFSSPYFSGSAGFLIGLISILSVFFLFHFLSRKSPKGMQPVPTTSGSRSKPSRSTATSDDKCTTPLIPTPKKSSNEIK